jgi:hypothetical protein
MGWQPTTMRIISPPLPQPTIPSHVRQVAAVRSPDGHMLGLFEPAE